MTVALPEGTTDRTMARLYPQPSPYHGNANLWAKVVLGEHLWSKQREIADSVRDNRYTAVNSAYGLGKSHIASRIVAHFIEDHEVGEAFAVTSAPTTRQVEAILWREIGKAHRKGNLQGRITLDAQWYIGQELVAYGRKPADYVDPEEAKAAFQGIHARYVLVVLDEAAGIPAWLWEAVDGLMTNADARVLAIGNPDNPDSEFARKCSNPEWNTIHISAFDSPHYTDEEVPAELYDLLTGPIWVEERRRDWGEDSMLWTSKVLGLFPKASEDGLIHPGWILNAKNRDLDSPEVGCYACDVGRKGADETVIGRMRGGAFRVEWHKIGVDDTTLIADELDARLERHKGAAYGVIDSIGVGAGVFDLERRRQRRVVEFVASEKAHDSRRFVNRRSEQWWRVREMFKDGEADIDPDDDKLANQLGQMKWFLKNGRIQIEAKEDMSKRGVKSPDRADTLMMATVNPSVLDSLVEDKDPEPESLTDDLMEMAM